MLADANRLESPIAKMPVTDPNRNRSTMQPASHGRCLCIRVLPCISAA